MAKSEMVCNVENRQQMADAIEVKIDECFDGIYSGKKPGKLSLFDLQAIPKKYLESDEIFASKVAEELDIDLYNGGVDRFTELYKFAYKSFWAAFNNDLPRFKMADSVKTKIEEGFSSISDIREFLSKVAIEDFKAYENFFRKQVFDRRSCPNREQLSICKLTKRMVSLNIVEKFYQQVLDYAPILFGDFTHDEHMKMTNQTQEPFFEGLYPKPKTLTDFIKNLKGGLEELINSKGFFHTINFQGGEFLFLNDCQLNGVRQVSFGLKSMPNLFRKVEQKSQVISDDALRGKILFDDWEKTDEEFSEELYENVYNLMSHSQNKGMKIEVRVKGGYLTNDQVKDLQDMFVDDDNISISGHHNPHSSNDYRMINTKISYLNEETKDPEFSFEMQMGGEKQNVKNENEELKSAHFAKDMIRLCEHTSRYESAMTDPEWKVLIGGFIDRYAQNQADAARQFLDANKPINEKTGKREFVSNLHESVKKLANSLHGKINQLEANPLIFIPNKVVGDLVEKLDSKFKFVKSRKPKDSPIYDSEGVVTGVETKKEFEIDLRGNQIADKIFTYLRMTGTLLSVESERKNFYQDLGNVQNKSLYLAKASLKNQKGFIESVA